MATADVTDANDAADATDHSRVGDISQDAASPRPLDRHGAVGAFDWGVLAAAAVSLAYGLLVYPVGLGLGLIAVGVFGGWVIGAAVARGAWRGEPHLPDRRLRLWSAVLGLISWLGGMFVAYVASGLLFPAANTPLTERIAFGDYIAGTFDIAHGAAAVVLVVVSWRSAR